jgi:CBS domain-containing protein
MHAVREAMTSDVEMLPLHAKVGDARHLFESGGHGAYPVVDDDGACVGIVTRTDLLVRELADDAPVTEVAHNDVVTVEPGDPLLTVLERITEDGVDHVPVIDQDRLVGICTRTDVLRARSRYLEHERPQAGWRPRLRRADGDGQRVSS